MMSCCWWLDVGLLVVLLFLEARSLIKSTAVCPVRPLETESRPEAECRCSALDEIHCCRLTAAPHVDPEAAYLGRTTYRSLYLARQHIRRLPAAAFAALNVRRIVLDFNPLGDRIDPLAFRGFVDDALDLRHRRLVTRRRRTSSHRDRSPPVGDAQTDIPADNHRTGNERAEQRHRKYRRRHRQTASGRELLRKVGDSVTWERFPSDDVDDGVMWQQTFTWGLQYALVELSMGACGIRTLPSTLLHDLHLLERFHLWGNLLEMLPRGLFRHSSRLTELLLWGNRIDELDSGAFEGLRALRRLDLDRNRLTVLPAAAVARLVSLRALRLADNQIHAVGADSFVALPGLRALRLDGNGIAYIYPRAFHGLVNLSVLELDRNAVHFLPDDVFVDLGRLTELRLADNQVEHVWARTFRGLRSLHRVQLTSNRLANLPDGAFGDSPLLRHLHLDGNRLQVVGRCTLSAAVASTSSLARRTRLMLTLDANPLRCDCRMLWLLDAVGNSGVRVSGTCWKDAQTLTVGGIVGALMNASEACSQRSSSTDAARLRSSVYCLNGSSLDS